MRHSIAVLILLGVGSIAGAQEVRLAATQAQTSHRLLGDPRGVVAGVAVPWGPALAVRITVNHLGYEQTRTGSTCTGLVRDPSACGVEPIEDATSMSGVTLGLVVTLARSRNVALALIPSAGAFLLRTESDGLQTGNQLSGASAMLAFAAGLELSVTPRPVWPVALHIGVHAGTMQPTDKVAVADGYSPFIDSIRINRAEVGFAVRIPRRPSR
jgi:hypothetical protein